jgi:riboflavin kinase/FMN adenylyltransferase
VGRDFQFGWRRSGNVALLERLGAELGFGVEAVPPLSLAGRTLSSTGIRELIRQGALEEVARWLGRPYLIAGTVVPGDGLGRKLGFATANLEVAGLQLPPSGVYAARAREPGTAWMPAVMNLGVRPTIGPAETGSRLEVHVLDRQPELYGRELEVWPVQRLRDEVRFPSREALRAQIAQDVATAREILQGGGGPELPEFGDVGLGTRPSPQVRPP